MKKIIIALAILTMLLIFTGVYFIDRTFFPNNDVDDMQIINYENNRNRFLSNNEGMPIIVGIYNSGYLYHSNHDHGINKDVIEELFNRMKLDYRIEILPRVRISSMISEGLLHMGVSTIETPERAEYSYFIPYFSEKNDVLVRNDAGISTEEELLKNKNIKVGIIRGYYYGEHYTNLIEKLEKQKMVVQAKDTEHLFKMLNDGWIQVTFNLATSYLYYIDYYDIKEISIYDWAPEEELLVRNLALSKKYFSPNDVVKFQQTIDEMIDDGTMYKIFNKYIPEENARRMCEQSWCKD
ncbi:MAG: amino acid ABC transporter substrate-binding protein [Clostridiaceae bacterium]|nr:amino acid ABC transporter substrate-binding protein [Clostridiaceae bacterium]